MKDNIYFCAFSLIFCAKYISPCNGGISFYNENHATIAWFSLYKKNPICGVCRKPGSFYSRGEMLKN